MMTHSAYPCHKARSLASSALDGELSELEARLLDRHLAACAPCAAFAREIAGVTDLLRAAPQEAYAVEIMPRLRHARRTVRRRAAVVSAGMLVAASILGVLASVTPNRSISDRPSTTTYTGTPAVAGPLGDGRGVPVVIHTQLPLGQLKAVDDF
jgi:predicted anti-sigma-YlaC factor YlaD